MTSGAIRTDFILSAEIMVIALNEVADQPFVPRLIILIVVAFVITIAVYGVVAAIVKMDDVGLALTQRKAQFAQNIGRGLVMGMPKLLAALSAIGTVAMLWVGGHILLLGTDTLGWHAPYGFVHHLEENVRHAAGDSASVGGLLAWLVNTGISAVIGLVVGAVVVAVVHVLPFGKKDAHAA
jgi:predicted DNA repair protein MutK